ncbi:MAG TPA: hypothetical protein VFG53_06960 [Anaeromyxobacter sp.]|nr:hypothetical protein [Anaeromyxobacter sp.]
MAEVNKTASAPPSPAGTRSGTGFELRLERGGASVRLTDRELATGLTLEVLVIQIPDVRFPFDVGQGANQFRHRLADLSELAVSASTPFLDAGLARAPFSANGLLDLRVELRGGFAELYGRLAAGPAFTLKAGLLPRAGPGLRVLFYSPRVFGPAPVPAASLPHLFSKVLLGAAGGAGELDPVAPILRQVLAPRGWKVPRSSEIRLARAEIDESAVRLAWSRGGGDRTEQGLDPDLLAAEEGSGAFYRVEAAIGAGEFSRARELLLAAGTSAAVHPFAAERLLSLLVLDERFHDEALDLAAEWLGRRPGFAPALSAEALVRLARGEEQRAARSLAELAGAAASRAEVWTALAAAESAFGLPGASPADASRAVEVALSLRRDHVPALRALRRLAAAGGDREALLRADRRLVAYDPDEAEKARAHAELGELLREADPPAARLHLDQALRLAPDDPATLTALARACAAAGEALRAVRALDRLRELHLARGDRAGAAAAALEAGALWEGPLDHPENALLRFRTAVELSPSAELHARAALAAERLGHWAESADHHAAVLASIDPATPGASALLARTRLALAEVAERRLNDPAGAAANLEAAAALQPDDPELLRRLVRLHRALNRPDGVAAALDRLAPLVPAPERALLLAEAGESLLSLGQADAARARFAAALAYDAANRPALSGLARLAATRGDAPAERDALSRLLPLAAGAAEVAELQDRFASACERAGDLSAAARAARAARGAIPSPARLDTELRLLRQSGESATLAALLPEAAQAAAAAGEPARAVALRLEQARLLSRESPAAALAALGETATLAPGEPGVLRAQADLAERTGDLKLALGALRALLASGAKDGPGLELRAARAALAAGEVAAAREHAARAEAASVPGAAELFDEVLARTGDGPARAELLARSGRLEEAARILEESGRPGLAAPLLERLGRPLEAARGFEAAGDIPRALAAFSRAAQVPASAGEALPRVVELRLATGDGPGAAAALLDLARLRGGPEGAELAWRAHGLSPDPTALDVAAACDPGFAPARARRAVDRGDLDPAGALADAEAALSAKEPLPPEERTALLSLAAKAAALAGNEAAARQHLAAYCELSPGDVGALTSLAERYRRAGDLAGLAAAIDRLLPHVRGSDAAPLLVERARISAASGDGAGAGRLLEEALTLSPEFLEALRALTDPPVAEAVPPARRAELLARRAAHPGATADEISAADGERARLLRDLGEAEAALEALRAAAARGTPDDDALELRAALAAAVGNAAEEAAALLERAERAHARGEPGAADRLAEAGLSALSTGLPGALGALESALALGPGRENERAVRLALLEQARASGEEEKERALLGGLVPLLRTGERPAALLRLSALCRAALDPVAARRAAEEARTLSPRDPGAVEAARAAAEAEGDLAAVADRLGELSELIPEERGRHLVARARLLAFLGRPEEADREYGLALAALPPDRELTEEQVRFRRQSLPAAAAAEPLEAYARRATDGREAARALRAAAALALAAQDAGTALRCARRALARSQDDLFYAGPLLARILYLGGSFAEALVLHRRLFEAGLDRLPGEEALVLAQQLAELAEAAGEEQLARAALDKVLALRPSDLNAATRRFALDPDRARAARELAGQADFCRSATSRAEALASAAEAALGDVGDATLADVLFRRARDATLRLPARAAALARRRAEAFRAAEGARSPVVVEALGEAAEQALQIGNREEARELFQEATALAKERGQLGRAAAFLLRQSELSAEGGEAAAHAREAGDLFAWAGKFKEAAAALRRALEMKPGDAEALALLEAVARAQGAEGASLLTEVLEERVGKVAAGPERARLRVALADAHLSSGLEGAAERSEGELRRALEDDPASAAATQRLSERLAGAGRNPERARLMLEQAAHETDRVASARLRREAAVLLAEAPGAADRAIAAATFSELATEEPRDLDAHRAAARLFHDLGQRERAISHLAALVRADPDDEGAAGDLAEAWSDRHRERAELFLERAEAAKGEIRAGRLREAAKALFAAGEDARARGALVSAFDAWPADDTAFVAALRDATEDVERIDAVLSARAAAVPSEAAACHRARADALLAFGEAERAVSAYQAALEVAPDDVAALAALAACYSAAGRDGDARTVDARLVARAEADPKAVSPSAEATARYRLGLAAWAEGRPVDGIDHLERALSLAPADERAGIAWAALAHGHAARGDRDLALAAARSRTERALALGLAEERRQALEAGAELAGQLGDLGRDAAEILFSLLKLRKEQGEEAEVLEPLARRAAASLSALGEEVRAAEAFALAGLAPPLAEPIPAPAPAPAPPAPAVEPLSDHAAPPDSREAARLAAEEAMAGGDPIEGCAALVRYAEALLASGAAAEEVRAALELSTEADPDSPAPWRVRARVESAAGDPAAAARAHLSISIRTEGEEAARSALEAARLFEEAGLHGQAVRAHRAAVHAEPGCVPARTFLAEEALSSGDAEGAAVHLAAIAPETVPAEERPAHARRLARAFEAAGRRADAEAVWTAILQGDGGDREAFERAAGLVRERGALTTWMELSQIHEQALARANDTPARAELRCTRGEVLAHAGRLEAARGAYLSALELAPDHRAGRALAELDGRREGWAQAAEELSAEAAQSKDPAERAALHLRRSRILLERLNDPSAAAVAAEESLVEARTSPLAAARRTASEAEILLGELGQSSGEPAPPPQPTADPVSAVLRAQAEAARGSERADLFERLAGHLERSGDRDGTADALLAALEADPDREPTYSWLRAVAAGDAERLARAQAIRAGELPAAGAGPPRTTLRFGTGQGADEEPKAPDAHEGGLPIDREGPPRSGGGTEVSFFPPLDLAASGPAPAASEPQGPASAALPLGASPPPEWAEDPPWAQTPFVPNVDLSSLAPRAPEAPQSPAPSGPGRETPDRQRGASRALEGWLEIARQQPDDVAALSALSALCARAAEDAEPAAAARLSERMRIAAGLACFVEPASPRPLSSGRLPSRLAPDLRAEVALPAAIGPSARLLSLLAPWLEPLFPADLGRRGASSTDWLAPPRAPALRGALDAAARALGTRPHASFLTRRPGVEVAIENTQPPAMVFSAGAGELPEPWLPFLAARTLDLVQHGWALGGKFAPRDVGILLELACRFAGGTAPSMGLPAERAGAYLAALSRTVPAGVLDRARLLASDAGRELADFDARGFGAALRRTASRVALLYAGDPENALQVLLALEPAGSSGPLDPARAILLPDLTDLARFALSDRFLEMRLSVLG